MNERIKELRKFLGLTLANFGEKLGVGKSVLSQIESGKTNITNQMFKSICREFNVNEEWLKEGTGEMFNSNINDELKALANKYNLSYNDYILVEKFINMSEKNRAVLINYIKEVASNFALTDEPKSSSNLKTSSFDLSKLTIDEKVALYRQELELEEKAEEKSVAL